VPGVDFSRVRAEITMVQVLDLLGFWPSKRSGVQRYGPCPLHDSSSRRCRWFSADVPSGRYDCQGCRCRANPLELWARLGRTSRSPLYRAAADLCYRLRRDVPWIRRSSRSSAVTPRCRRRCHHQRKPGRGEATGTQNIHPITRFPSIIVIGGQSIILTTLNEQAGCRKNRKADLTLEPVHGPVPLRPFR